MHLPARAREWWPRTTERLRKPEEAEPLQALTLTLDSRQATPSTQRFRHPGRRYSPEIRTLPVKTLADVDLPTAAADPVSDVNREQEKRNYVDRFCNSTRLVRHGNADGPRMADDKRHGLGGEGEEGQKERGGRGRQQSPFRASVRRVYA